MSCACVDLTVVGPIRLRKPASRSFQRAILVAALPSLFAACSFNADPAMHPPRGLALPPPVGLAGPRGPVLASTTLVQVRSADPAKATTRTVPPARPTQAVVPDGNR
jgi:hypothetical protein